jgi:hypothetical protein
MANTRQKLDNEDTGHAFNIQYLGSASAPRLFIYQLPEIFAITTLDPEPTDETGFIHVGRDTNHETRTRGPVKDDSVESSGPL